MKSCISQSWLWEQFQREISYHIIQAKPFPKAKGHMSAADLKCECSWKTEDASGYLPRPLSMDSALAHRPDLPLLLPVAFCPSTCSCQNTSQAASCPSWPPTALHSPHSPWFPSISLPGFHACVTSGLSVSTLKSDMQSYWGLLGSVLSHTGQVRVFTFLVWTCTCHTAPKSLLGLPLCWSMFFTLQGKRSHKNWSH